MTSANINYFSQNINFSINDENKISEWLHLISKSENFNLSEINYIFCNDNFLYSLNIEYLNHNTFTDVISFDFSERTDQIAGDIYISIERISENANKFNKTINNELFRVMAHGLLHLLGYSDKTKSEKLLMTKKEDYYLSLLKNNK
ncbi:MAG: rRNA maturation RNase YbeY [Bacteroidales bacterium]|nr:rRNA maturation RNase YbeY [Bacteroidales bacterium]